MGNDRLVGVGILLASIVVVIVYALLLYFGHGSMVAVILVSVAFFALLGVAGWIGWTIATTPTPKASRGRTWARSSEVVEVRKTRRGRPRKKKAA